MVFSEPHERGAGQVGIVHIGPGPQVIQVVGQHVRRAVVVERDPDRGRVGIVEAGDPAVQDVAAEHDRQRRVGHLEQMPRVGQAGNRFVDLVGTG